MMYPDFTIQVFRQEINRCERVTFALLQCGQIVGIADIAKQPGEGTTLGNIFVAAGERRKGLGKGLVEAAQSWIAEHNDALWVRVEPETWCVEWYERCGFLNTQERDSAGRLWMRWLDGKRKESTPNCF